MQIDILVDIYIRYHFLFWTVIIFTYNYNYCNNITL